MRHIELLDLFCGGGGASAGYVDAAQKLGLSIGVTGVDLFKKKNYPYHFVQLDAMEYLEKHWNKFTHIHASPPCKRWTAGGALSRSLGVTHEDLLTPIRDFLYSIPISSVIENVPRSPVRPDIVLSGLQFGLKVIRKRNFELIHWFAMRPGMPGFSRGIVKRGEVACVFGHGSKKNRAFQRDKSGWETMKLPGNTILEQWSYAMGINWMNIGELAQAIPPAYTEYIGKQWFKDFI